MKKTKTGWMIIHCCTAMLAVCSLIYGIIYTAVGYQVKEHRQDGVVLSVTYNGKTYHRLGALAGEYCKFIPDKQVSRKLNLLLPRSYYTLKNDAGCDFLYSAAFRDPILYTCLPIGDTDDLTKKKVTDILICQSGWQHKKVFSSDPVVISYCSMLKQTAGKSACEDCDITMQKNECDWYRLYFAYDNMPICTNDGIDIAEHNGKFYLALEFDEHQFKGVPIACDALTEICLSFPKTIE